MNRLNKLAAKYLMIAKIGARNKFAYPANIFIEACMFIVRGLIYYSLYKVTFAAAGENNLSGYTLPQIIWLLTFANAVYQTRYPHISTLIAEQVQNGEIAYFMTRPYSFVFYHLFSHLGRALANLSVNIFLAVIFNLIAVGPISITLWQILIVGILILSGIILDTFLSIVTGLASFWIEDHRGLDLILSKCHMIFAGNIIPIAFLPEWAQNIALALPFYLFNVASGMVLVGDNFVSISQILLSTAIWLVVFMFMTTFVFHRACRNLEVNGG